MEIQFSKEAFDDLDKIEDYLLKRWNDKVLEDFNLKLDHCLQLITDGIAVFQKYEDTIYQKILITKHNTLIYKIDCDVLKVVKILQNFQDPDENYKSLFSKLKPFLAISFLLLLFSYSLQDLSLIYPSYFPKPVYDFKKNPLKSSTVQLGRKLFYDPILSRDNTISCSSCHLSNQAFSHAGNHLSKGIEHGIGDRNSPAIFNLAWQKTFMWDGSVVNIDVQALAPINHPAEMGEDINAVVRKLNRSKEYKTLFYKSFGDSLATSERLMKALSQFQLTIVSANSKYDKVRQGKATFMQSEKNGYQLFKQNCSSCHQEPLFSTYGFANNGLSYNSELKDYGKWNKTFEPADKMMFKIPSLRNLAFTYPYMHDGRFKTLYEVLEHYEKGIEKSPTLAKQLEKPIVFTPKEKEDLLAFLTTLNDYVLVSNVEYQKTK